MGKFIMAIWLPWCWKTTYYENELKDDYVHISSDKIREELYWDVNDQEHNEEVFQEMYRRTVETLKQNKNVYYDATNISRKRREHLLNQLKQRLREYTIRYHCVIFAIDIDEVKRRNKQRERVVPEYVIDKMFKNICIPEYEEWWDKIKVINLESAKWICERLLNELMDMPHDNPNHTLTIWKHMCKASEEYANSLPQEVIPIFKVFLEYKILYYTIRYHDLWKLYTKEFDEDWVAHYYNHQNISAYIYLCDCKLDDNHLLAAKLILHHMDLYNKNINKEAIINKYWEPFLERLEVVNTYDIKWK